MNNASLAFINSHYMSDIAILFCRQLEAMHAGMAEVRYKSLQRELIEMCFEHDDGALISCIMPSRAGDDWKAYRQVPSGKTLLMRSVKNGCMNVYKALLQSQCPLAGVNAIDGYTVFDYVCEDL